MAPAIADGRLAAGRPDDDPLAPARQRRRLPRAGGRGPRGQARRAGPGDRVPFADGFLELAEDEAWLLSDASDEEAAAAGFGEPIDSRRYGPVPLELLVGRAWFRYAPLGRLGRIPRGRLRR